MRYTVDRITDRFLVVQDENGVSGNLDKSLFEFMREGDVFSVTVEHNETKTREKNMQTKLQGLFQKGQKNDKK